MTDKVLKLGQFLPYRLSIASNLVSDAISRAYARLFALTVPEWRLIAVIAEGGAITQQQLCAKTRMDKVTVSRGAIALVNRGLIERQPNPDDGRSQLLFLSEEGLELYRHVVPQALALEARIFGVLSEDQLAQFGELLDLISQSATQAGILDCQ